LEWTPRALGVASFGFLLIALQLSGGPEQGTLLTTALGVVGAGLLALLIWQEDLALGGVRGRASGVAQALTQRPGLFRRFWIVSSFLLAALFSAVAMVWPVEFSQQIGPAATVFLGVALIIPVVSSLIFSERSTKLPVVPVLLLLAAAVSLMPWADNHRVGRRAFAPEGATVAPRKESANAAFTRWRGQALPPVNGVRPVIFVASEGGASRAAYWTAVTMGALQDQTHGRFSRSTFAVTSVSGGSLGAAGFIASLDSGAARSALRPSLEGFVGQDFLSPALVGMLYSDLQQRFLPMALLPDRAETIERSWESAWDGHCPRGAVGCAGLFARPFLSLWPDKAAWRPALLIEGASEESGDRIITSNLAITPDLMDADDFHEVAGRDVRVSTAVLNGGRYPWISPAGTFTGRAGAQHIVDGGYFDATGVEATRELAHGVLPQTDKPDDLVPVFVIIGNCGATESGVPGATSLLADALAPFVGLYDSRSSHGRHVASRLRVDVTGVQTQETCVRKAVQGSFENRKAYFVPLKLCQVKGYQVPLDWALSDKARRRMQAAAGFGVGPKCQDAIDNLKWLSALINGEPVADLPKG
jgi:hypothetical protein